MNFARYNKAIGALLGILIPLGGAVLALGVLSGPASHDLAVILAALTPISGTFGVVIAPANATAQAAVSSTADAVKAVAAEWQAIHDAVTNTASPLSAAEPAPAVETPAT